MPGSSSFFFHSRIANQTSAYKKPRSLRPFNESESEIFRQWSLLPSLFADWDLDRSGAINKEALLFGIDMFCKIHRVHFASRDRLEILQQVDENHDELFDQDEFVAFLTEFSRIVNVSIIDVVRFMMDFLAEREEWHRDFEAIRGVGLTGPGQEEQEQEQVLNNASTRVHHVWGFLMSSLDDELETIPKNKAKLPYRETRSFNEHNSAGPLSETPQRRLSCPSISRHSTSPGTMIQSIFFSR